jgi:nucleotide-binding universal stress UspA family protein
MTDATRLQTILVPHDFSPTADRAVEVACALAQAAGPAQLILVHAHFVPLEIEALAVRGAEEVFRDIETQACERLDELVRELESAGQRAEYVALQGTAEGVILKLAEDKGADIIVMGTHGRRGLGHVFLGSIAERVLRMAQCPVITVPPPPEASSS